jgi:cyanate permease
MERGGTLGFLACKDMTKDLHAPSTAILTGFVKGFGFTAAFDGPWLTCRS